MSSKLPIILCITLLLASSNGATAKDFGKYGHTYKVEEQPFLQMINERLKKVDIEQERKKMEQIAKMRVSNPRAVDAITPAKHYQAFYYDPTYALDEDAVLPCGKILFAKGTTVNPLEHMSLERRLLFIDARREPEVKWLKERLQEPKEGMIDKVILLGGSPLKLQEELSREVYFDQDGTLTTTFGIQHSPSIVMQDGLRLKVEEFALEEDEK
jgi:conjugal transfer pilus assembly protein TraW